MSALPWGLLPDSSTVGVDGQLLVGGCDLAELAEEFGTPLFVYDEAQLKARCAEAVAAFGDGVAYATKAFLCRAMARLAHEQGMHLDVASGGELAVALSAGVPADRIVLHGNNKSDEELITARDAGVGRIVVDSFDELDRLEGLFGADGIVPQILLRITPGVEAHTHEFVMTGQDDSKFGFGLKVGDAARAVERARAMDAVELVGIHAHIGSQVFVAGFFEQAIEALAPFVNQTGLPELSIGGGIGVAYIEGEEAPSITEWGAVVRKACDHAGITARVSAEPGRAIAAAAGITVYRVGTIKEVPSIRTFVAVDGGFIDNPRPALYGSGYETFVPAAVTADRTEVVRLVGKHCESGDVLVSEAKVPAGLVVGDLIATPVTGAYGRSMGSNYNLLPRPAVVFVADGQARLVIRRETEADLLATDVG
ncbi:diaminopimelate decarboxylase [Aquihabitans sp. McL0605]|uniref:diaminopimelate decarboxylase n=1 Tax=Aquihabitans sp. McL0605 TaxID=3415671 RepID=UPI003CF560B2